MASSTLTLGPLEDAALRSATFLSLLDLPEFLGNFYALQKEQEKEERTGLSHPEARECCAGHPLLASACASTASKLLSDRPGEAGQPA